MMGEMPKRGREIVQKLNVNLGILRKKMRN